MTPISTPFSLTTFSRVVQVVDDLAAGDPAPHLGRVDVEDRHEFVTLADEILVGQQGRAQVADPHQGHLPDLVQPQDALDFKEQFLDEIAHAPDAELAEVCQIFANLRRVDAAFFRQLVRGNNLHPLLGQGLQVPGINGQAGNGGRGDFRKFHR